VGCLLTSGFKLVLSKYPTVHDYEMMMFFILLNITFVKKYTVGFKFLIWAASTTYQISASIYVTWQARVQGNANLDYF
jgi:hypothetical protein